MYKATVFKCLSVVTILAMLLAFAPPAGVRAAAADITGTLYGVPDGGLSVTITATRTAGSAGSDTCQVTIVTDGSASNAFTITGCDNADTFTVSAADEFSRYTYSQATGVTGGGFGGVELAVLRTFSGRITHGDSLAVVGYALPIAIGGVNQFAPATDAGGLFSFQAPDNKDVTIYPPGTEPPDGYNVNGPYRWTANAPLKNDWTGFAIELRGNRRAWVDIGGSGPCRLGATVTFTPTGGGTAYTNITNGDGGADFNRLEPLEYDITVAKAGCAGVYSPDYITSNTLVANPEAKFGFNVPWIQIRGRARLANDPDTPLALYLVANFTYLVGGVTYTYQSAVDPFGGWFDIGAPFHNGLLTISRVGGAANLGYEPVVIPIVPTLGVTDVYQDVTLVPNGTITGRVLGQNDVPVHKDARLDFGSGLSMLASGAVDGSFTINGAQPKLYYVAPSGSPIRKLETPVRALANLTAIDTADVGTFTANFERMVYDGCIRTRYNDDVELPAGGVRIRSEVGSVATYTATITENDTAMCGPGPGNQSYHLGWDVQIPRGVYGDLEVDNHTVVQPNPIIDTWDMGKLDEIRVYGDRIISGKLFYAANPDIRPDDDNPWNTLLLRHYYGSSQVDANREYDGQTHEFQLPNLERETYRLTANFTIPGYDIVPHSGIPALGGSLIIDTQFGNVDLGVIYTAEHKPIPEASRLPLNGAVLPNGTFDLSWSQPPLNPKDYFTGYQLQFGLNGTTFTDSSPAPLTVYDDPPVFHAAGWAPGLYQWRVRGVYMYFRDYGPWTALDSFTILGANPSAPANGSAILTNPAAPVTFTWTTDPASLPGYKYQVQYSTSSTFSSGNTTLPSVSDPTHQATTPGTLTTKTKYYWHVRVVDLSDVPISEWSDTWNFYYNLLYPSPSLLSYAKSGGNITFTATQTNAVLPPDALYLVQYVLSGLSKPAPTSGNTWLFSMHANGVPSDPLPLAALPAGTYKWYIRIVSSGDPYNSIGYTGWIAPTTSGMITFTTP